MKHWRCTHTLGSLHARCAGGSRSHAPRRTVCSVVLGHGRQARPDPPPAGSALSPSLCWRPAGLRGLGRAGVKGLRSRPGLVSSVGRVGCLWGACDERKAAHTYGNTNTREGGHTADRTKQAQQGKLQPPQRTVQNTPHRASRRPATWTLGATHRHAQDPPVQQGSRGHHLGVPLPCSSPAPLVAQDMHWSGLASHVWVDKCVLVRFNSQPGPAISAVESLLALSGLGFASAGTETLAWSVAPLCNMQSAPST